MEMGILIFSFQNKVSKDIVYKTISHLNKSRFSQKILSDLNSQL